MVMLWSDESQYLDCNEEKQCNEQKKKSGLLNGTWKCSEKEHVVKMQMISAMKKNLNE